MLGGLRITFNCPEAIFGPRVLQNTANRIIYSIISLLLLPLHPLLLHLHLYDIDLRLKKNPRNKSLCFKKQKITFHLRNFTKIELGLETMFQIAGMNILLLCTKSNTRTHDSQIYILFKDEENEYLPLEVFHTITYFSMVYSFISCVRSHLVVLSADREYFPLSSKSIAGLYAMMAITKRILAIIMFFAPALGLFDLLYHWQAEQTKWHPALLKYFVDSNETIQFGQSPPLNWQLIDRWKKNKTETPLLKDESGLYKLTNPNYHISPPNYNLYTIFTLEDIFYIFCVIFCLHVVIIILVKWKWSHAFRNMNILDVIVHGIENTNIPFNVQEWESINSNDVESYTIVMKSNLKEGIALIVINCVFSCVQLFPLSILGKICCLITNFQFCNDCKWQIIDCFPDSFC